jgi:hypothetical protein
MALGEFEFKFVLKLESDYWVSVGLTCFMPMPKYALPPNSGSGGSFHPNRHSNREP